jgi:hypothetical protein
MKNVAYLALMMLIATFLIKANSAKKLNDFGMNKPHLLFHLG